MAERLRFHLDENVDPALAAALRRHGVDVTTTPEAGLRTRDDQAQLAYIRGQSRVIVTHDVDFLRFASSSDDHPGIVFCLPNRRTLGDMIRAVILIYEVLAAEEMAGKVEFL